MAPEEICFLPLKWLLPLKWHWIACMSKSDWAVWGQTLLTLATVIWAVRTYFKDREAARDKAALEALESYFAAVLAVDGAVAEAARMANDFHALTSRRAETLLRGERLGAEGFNGEAAFAKAREVRRLAQLLPLEHRNVVSMAFEDYDLVAGSADQVAQAEAMDENDVRRHVRQSGTHNDSFQSLVRALHSMRTAVEQKRDAARVLVVGER